MGANPEPVHFITALIAGNAVVTRDARRHLFQNQRGMNGFSEKSLYALSASWRTSSGSALYCSQNSAETRETKLTYARAFVQRKILPPDEICQPRYRLPR